MSSFISLFASVFACGLVSLLLRDMVLSGLDDPRKRVFRRDERIHFAILALALLAHYVVFGADLVTTQMTQWGTDLSLSAIVLLTGTVRFMDIIQSARNQLAED